MKEREVFHVWDDDSPDEIMGRLKLALIEMGIKVIEIGQGADCKIFEFEPAEPLTR
jgi:hypothetical protein